MSIEFKHISVLLDESIKLLDVKPNGIYVDGTLGGGGHSELICSKLGDGGRLIGIDRDETALRAAGERLARFGDSVSIVHSNYADIKNVLKQLNIEGIDGAVLDLGVSSPQLDDAERGFSYNAEARLDMRMDRGQALSAYEVVNDYSEEELSRIIFEYGEERHARRIARQIAKVRKRRKIETTTGLSELIKSVIPAKERFADKHPAKRTFQAIRIEVNNELDIIAPTLRALIGAMKSGGVLAVLTFHSLEDRAVKKTFAELAQGCTCPPSFPVCICGNKPKIEILTRKPVLPSAEELAENNRSHSAKLRAARKI